jgi:acyl-CoA thioesterase II
MCADRGLAFAMRDLGSDTRVSGHDGRYTANLHEGWDIWGPQGGYVCGVALGAAAAESSFLRPTSFACHFLRPAQLGAVELRVESLRRTRRAESLRVTCVQGDAAVMDALIWIVDGLEGIDHDAARRPDAPEPDAVEPWQSYLPGGEMPFPYWSNFDVRPIRPEPAGWTTAGDPRFLAWMRLRSRPDLDDPVVDAARMLAVADSAMFPAATLAHDGGFPYTAPSLDLNVSCHRVGEGSEWLLVDGVSPLAERAVVSGSALIWSKDGRLLATATQQMLQRPNR